MVKIGNIIINIITSYLLIVTIFTLSIAVITVISTVIISITIIVIISVAVIINSYYHHISRYSIVLFITVREAGVVVVVVEKLNSSKGINIVYIDFWSCH